MIIYVMRGIVQRCGSLFASESFIHFHCIFSNNKVGGHILAAKSLYDSIYTRDYDRSVNFKIYKNKQQ